MGGCTRGWGGVTRDSQVVFLHHLCMAKLLETPAWGRGCCAQ